MQIGSCSLFLQALPPKERYLAVVSTMPDCLKGALVLTLCFDGGMLDVHYSEADEYAWKIF